MKKAKILKKKYVLKVYYFKVIQKSQNCRRNSLFSKNSDDWLLIDDVTIWRETAILD